MAKLVLFDGESLEKLNQDGVIDIDSIESIIKKVGHDTEVIKGPRPVKMIGDEFTVKVYIASPYTVGDTAVNVRRQMEIGNALMNYGFAPFMPLLSHYQQIMHPRNYEEWLKMDKTWVESCNAVLRIGGGSPGGDREVNFAKNAGIPVYYSLDGLLNAFKGKDC